MNETPHNLASERSALLNIAPKWRENALTAVVRNQFGIAVYARSIDAKTKTQVGPVIGPTVLMYKDLSDSVRAEAFGYGLEVRLTRAAAIEHAKSGRPATAQERFDAIERLCQHYASGTDAWNMSGGGGGGLGQEAKILIEALMRVFSLDEDAAEMQVRGMSADERLALSMDDDIRPTVETIRKERAGKVDTKALLEKLRRA